jgi:hypothetical protein
LVILTGWYAYSTSNLIGVNEQQIEAARASSMPALDVTYHEKEDGELYMTIRNRGQGVARNVTILFSVVGRGIDTCQINLSESLPPQFTYKLNKSEGIDFYPKFYTGFTDKSFREVIESPDEVIESSDLLSTKSSFEDVSATNLQELMMEMRDEFELDAPLPTGEGDLRDILKKHTEGRMDKYSPAIYLQVTFTDVMYGETHTETVIDGGYVHPEEPSLNNLLPGAHTLRTGITGKVKPFREVHGDIVRGPYPHITDLEVEVCSMEP